MSSPSTAIRPNRRRTQRFSRPAAAIGSGIAVRKPSIAAPNPARAAPREGGTDVRTFEGIYHG
jgi:hypothetical protein